jgi:tetratricopeptide (TPR) repeat protein
MVAGSSLIDHEHTQDAYERVLLRIAALTVEERYADAMSLLDELLQSYQDVDHDGWLHRTVVSHRALLLLDMGRWEEALAEYEARARLGFHDPSEHYEQALGHAVCLSGLQRYKEAIQVLEEGLARLRKSHVGSALGLLYRLAQACAALGQPVPPQYAPLLEATAAVYSVEVPHAFSMNPAQLGDAIMAVFKEVRERSVRDGPKPG